MRTGKLGYYTSANGRCGTSVEEIDEYDSEKAISLRPVQPRIYGLNYRLASDESARGAPVLPLIN